MKAVLVLLFAISAIECRKIVPINKNANIDFINMESGGARPPPVRPAGPAPAPAKPQSFEPPKSPTAAPPKSPVPAVTTAKPVLVTVAPATVPPPTQIKPLMPQPAKPLPNQMDLKPVPAKPAAAGGPTTPGYGNVKQLVTFYDSKGQASVIRPYSYADAVKKQG